MAVKLWQCWGRGRYRPPYFSILAAPSSIDNEDIIFIIFKQRQIWVKNTRGWVENPSLELPVMFGGDFLRQCEECVWILRTNVRGWFFWKYLQTLLNDWINWRLGRQPEKFHFKVVFAVFFILNYIRKAITLRRGFSKIGTPWCFPSRSPQISPGYSWIHQRNNHCKQKEIMKTELCDPIWIYPI